MVGEFIFAIYAILLFAALAPNVLIRFTELSPGLKIAVHGVIYLVLLAISYAVWSLLPQSKKKRVLSAPGYIPTTCDTSATTDDADEGGDSPDSSRKEVDATKRAAAARRRGRKGGDDSLDLLAEDDILSSGDGLVEDDVALASSESESPESQPDSGAEGSFPWSPSADTAGPLQSQMNALQQTSAVGLQQSAVALQPNVVAGGGMQGYNAGYSSSTQITPQVQNLVGTASSQAVNNNVKDAQYSVTGSQGVGLSNQTYQNSTGNVAQNAASGYGGGGYGYGGYGGGGYGGGGYGYGGYGVGGYGYGVGSGSGQSSSSSGTSNITLKTNASTVSTTPVKATDTKINVASTDGFKVGDSVLISDGKNSVIRKIVAIK